MMLIISNSRDDEWNNSKLFSNFSVNDTDKETIKTELSNLLSQPSFSSLFSSCIYYQITFINSKKDVQLQRVQNVFL